MLVYVRVQVDQPRDDIQSASVDYSPGFRVWKFWFQSRDAAIAHGKITDAAEILRWIDDFALADENVTFHGRFHWA